MNVLIDFSQIRPQKAGVGIYAQQLLAHLVTSPGFLARPDVRLFTLIQDDDPALDYSSHPRVTVIRVPSRLFRIIAFRILLEQLYIPYLVRMHRIDVVHSLHYSFPLYAAGARRVVTVHDMTSFVCPEYLIPSKAAMYRFFISRAATRVDRILYDSDSSRRDFMARFHAPPERNRVVLLGPMPSDAAPLSEAEAANLREQMSVRSPYLLFIGMLEPRKNVARLVRAFARFRQTHPQHSLVIVGQKGWDYEEIFSAAAPLGDAVRFTGYISHEQKRALLMGASIFVYPSLYEGFGIPVLEAMSYGLPAITSNVSSLPEVAGDGALLIDPLDDDALVAAISRLADDSAFAVDLRRRALAQAATFSWQKTADKTLEAYLDACGLSASALAPAARNSRTAR